MARQGFLNERNSCYLSICHQVMFIKTETDQILSAEKLHLDKISQGIILLNHLSVLCLFFFLNNNSGILNLTTCALFKLRLYIKLVKEQLN